MANNDFLITQSGLFYVTHLNQNYVLDGYLADPDTIQLFDFSVNLMAALLWQYQNADNIQQLLQQKQNWYDENQRDFWNNWVQDVFNLETANSFGLAVWSVILNQPTYINNGPALSSQPAWGFGQYWENFTRGNFVSYNGQTYQLPEAYARIILQIRYFQLTSSGTVPEINRMLKWVFRGYGPVYLIDNHDMTQSYYFAFPIPTDLFLALSDFDILPRPAGVKSTIVQGS